MKENKKRTPLEIVERYHQGYLDYVSAFDKNPFDEAELQKQLKEVAESEVDIDSEPFLDKMVDIVIEKPQKMADVNAAAFKFMLFVDFYLLTEEKELPEHILKDYDTLPIKDNMKTYFSIKDGEFVKNEKEVVSDDMRKYFKDIIAQIKSQ